jgi:hypothetical protein
MKILFQINVSTIQKLVEEKQLKYLIEKKSTMVVDVNFVFNGISKIQ